MFYNNLFNPNHKKKIINIWGKKVKKTRSLHIILFLLFQSDFEIDLALWVVKNLMLMLMLELHLKTMCRNWNLHLKYIKYM